jgi:excisionase family DNA binding protein
MFQGLGTGENKKVEPPMTRGSVLARIPEHSNGSNDEYLRAGEAAEILHVSPKTMSRWAKEGRVPHIVTLGGHRRFSRKSIEELAQRMFGQS